MDSFSSDIYLIYKNCRQFNSIPGNDYWKLADIMEQKTQELLGALPKVTAWQNGTTGMSIAALVRNEMVNDEIGDALHRFACTDFAI